MGGTFTLTHDGQTTSSLGYNATAAQVQSALESLSTIGSGNVTVGKSVDTFDAQEWTLTFTGSLTGTNVVQTTVNSGSVSYYGMLTNTEVTDTAGASDVDEVQTVTLSAAEGGQFRLAFAGETTKRLDYDATAAQVESALEELNSVDNVSVSGNAGGPWTITFLGSNSGTDVDPLNGDASMVINGDLGNSFAFSYDAAHQLTSIADDYSSYAYTYDNLGRVLIVDNDGTPGVANVILTSAFNAGGHRTSLSAEIDSTDDFVNSYTYDALNRLTQLDQGATGSASVAEKRVDFSYNAIGQFTSIARFNDLDGGSGDEVATSTYSYDTLGRLTGLAYKNGGTNLFTPYEWSCDNLSSAGLGVSISADGRVAAIASAAAGSGLGRITQFVSADGTSDYTYDATSQLTAADHDYQSDESYSYDANGNRTMTGYDTGTNNRLTNDGTYSYTYDDEGNRITRTNDTTYEITEYEWDHRNRLVRVTEKNEYEDITQVVEYTYDVFNRRIARAVDTTSPFTLTDAAIESYVYDDNGIAPNPFDVDTSNSNVVLDFLDPDGSGSQPSTLNSRQLFGPAVDQILAQENVSESISSADRVLWHLADNLGTVRDLVKNDGTLGEHYKYDSYGNVISGDTSVTRYLFTSREYDPATGLQYNRARWYDTETGRWMSEDLLGLVAGDAHLTRYVGNSPTNRIDASGLDWLDSYGSWFNDTFGDSYSRNLGEEYIYPAITTFTGNDGLANASANTLALGTTVFATAVVVGGYYGGMYLVSAGSQVITTVSIPTLNLSGLFGASSGASIAGGEITLASGAAITGSTTINITAAQAAAGLGIMMMAASGSPTGPFDNMPFEERVTHTVELQASIKRLEAMFNEATTAPRRNEIMDSIAELLGEITELWK